MRISLIIVKNIIRDVEMMYRMRCSTLDILLLCISFYEFTDMPHSLFLLIKYTIIAYLFFSHCGECKKMQRIVISILVYGGITFIATIVRQNMLNRYVASFVYMLHILKLKWDGSYVKSNCNWNKCHNIWCNHFILPFKITRNR